MRARTLSPTSPVPQGRHDGHLRADRWRRALRDADDARRASEREATGRGSADSVVADHEDAPDAGTPDRSGALAGRALALDEGEDGHTDADGDQDELAARHSLKRVQGLSTELEDMTDRMLDVLLRSEPAYRELLVSEEELRASTRRNLENGLQTLIAGWTDHADGTRAGARAVGRRRAAQGVPLEAVLRAHGGLDEQVRPILTALGGRARAGTGQRRPVTGFVRSCGRDR